MKGFINFINPFVGYIILPPFFTVYHWFSLMVAEPSYDLLNHR